MDFSPGWDCSFSLRAGIVDVAAMGTLVNDCPRGHPSDCGRLRVDARAIYPVDGCFEHECCCRYPPLYADCDSHSHAFPLIMHPRRASLDRGQACLPESAYAPSTFREHCLPGKISRLFPHFFSCAPIKLYTYYLALLLHAARSVQMA